MLGILAVTASVTPAAALAATPELTRIETLATESAVNSMQRSRNRIFIGGEFTHVSPVTGPVAELNSASGRLQRRFPPLEGHVSALASDGAGGFFAGGRFTTAAGPLRRNLIHVLASGELDPLFAAQVDNAVNVIVRQGARLYIGGSFVSVGGRSRNGVAAVSAASGAVDPSFDPNPQGEPFSGQPVVGSLAVSGSRLYIGGAFKSVAGSPRSNLAAVNSTTGALAPGFDPSAPATTTRPPDVSGPVAALALSGGRLYVGGEFAAVGRSGRRNLAALDPVSGAVDPSIDPAPPRRVTALLSAGSRLYVSGDFDDIGGSASSGLAALDPESGAPDAGFRPDRGITSDDLTLAGPRLVVSPSESGCCLPPVAFDAASGRMDQSFDPALVGGLSSAVLGTTSGVLVAGRFLGAGGERRNGLAAIDATSGSLVQGFAPDVRGTVAELKVSGRRLFVRGRFPRVEGQRRFGLAAVSKRSGRLDRRFRPPRVADVEAIHPAGRRLFIGGRFTRVGRTRRLRLAAVSARTGRLDGRFRPRVQTRRRKDHTSVMTLASRGRRLFVGGLFNRVNGRRRESLTAVGQRTGSLARGFRGGADSIVSALVVSGSRLYVSGEFTYLGGRRRAFFGRIGTGRGRLDRRFRPAQKELFGPPAVARGRVFSAHFREIREASARSGRLLRIHRHVSEDGFTALVPTRARLHLAGSIGGNTRPSRTPLGLQGLSALDLRP